MRSSSSDRRRPWNAPPPKKSLEQRQAVKLTVPSVSADRTLASLHSRLSGLISRITEFVNASCDMLSGGQAAHLSAPIQEKVLEELLTERGKWEQFTYYALAVHEDVLRKQTPQSLDTVPGDLGTAVGDFKRISQLVADTQNQITLAMRKAGRREDSSLNSRVWQAFTALNQNIYEAFFRRRRNEDNSPAFRTVDEDAAALRKQIRTLETQLTETQLALKVKDGEMQKRAKDTDLFTKAEYVAQLETDLQRATELATRLRADVAARDSALRELERRVRPPSHQLSPRAKAKEALHRSTELSTMLQRFSDASQDQRRPGSATPGESKLELKELEIELSREREKSRSFFNALKRKEKECDELYESLGTHSADEELQSLKKEKEELLKALGEARRTEQRQMTEVSQFASVIKSLERDKVKLEQEKARLAKDLESASSLKSQLAESSEAHEDLRKQLKLTVEEKHKLLKLLNGTKTELAKTAEGYTTLEKERDLLLQKADALTQERELLLRKLGARHERAHEDKDKQASQLAIAKIQGAMESRLDQMSKSLSDKEDRLSTLKSTFETKLREYESIIREVNDRTNSYESELAEVRARCEDAESRLQMAESEADGLRLQAARAQDRSHQTELENEELRRDLQVLTDKCEEITEQLKVAQLQCREDDAVLAQVRYERETFESESSTLCREVEDLKAQIIAIQRQQVDEVADANARIEKLQFQLSATQKHAETAPLLADAKAQMERLSGRLEAALLELAELRQQRSAQDKEIAVARDKLRAAETEAAAWKLQCAELRENQSAQQDCEALRARLDSLESESEEVKGELEKTQGDLKEANTALRNALSRCDQYRRELENRDSELATLREKARVGEMDISEMSSLLKVAEEQLKAVELVQSQQKSLLKAKDDEIAAIEEEKSALLAELRKTKNDLDQTTKAHRKSDKAAEDLRNEIDRLRKFESEHRSLAGKVAEQSQTIDRLKAEHHSLTQSLSAEVTNSQQEKDQMLTALQLQVRELENEKVDLDSQLEDVIQRLSSSEQARNRMEERLGELQEEKKQHAAESTSLHKQVASLQQQLIASFEEKKDLEDEAEAAKSRLETAENEFRSEKEQVTALLEEMKRKEDKFKDTIKELTQTLSDSASRESKLMEEYTKRALEATAKTQSLATELENCEKELKNREKELENSEKQLENYEKELSASRAELGSRNALLAELRHNIADTESKLSALMQEVGDLLTAKSTLEQTTQERDSLMRKNAELANAHQQFSELYDRLVREHEQLKSSCAEMKGANDALRKQLGSYADLQETVNSLQHDKEAALAENTESTAALNRLIGELEAQLAESKSRELSSERESGELRMQLQQAAAALENSENTLTALRADALSLQAELASSQTTAAHLTQELAALKTKPATLDQETTCEMEPEKSSTEDYDRLAQEYSDLQRALIEQKDASEKMRLQLQHQAALLKQAKDGDRHKLKGSDSAREHRKIEDLTAHIAEMGKQREELEGSLISALKELEKRKNELNECRELLAAAQTANTQPAESQENTEKEAIAEYVRTAVAGLSSTMEHTADALGCRLAEIDTKASNLVKNAVLCIRRYAVKLEACQSTQQSIIAQFKAAEQTLNTVDSFSAIVCTKLTEADSKASHCISSLLKLAQHCSIEHSLAKSRSTEIALQELFSSYESRANSAMVPIEVKISDLDDRACGLLSKCVQRIRYLGGCNEAMRSSSDRCRSELQAEFSASWAKAEERLGTIGDRMNVLDSRVSETIAKLMVLVVRLSDRCNGYRKRYVEAERSLEAKNQETEAMVSSFRSGLPAVLSDFESRTNAMLASLSQRVSAAETKVSELPASLLRLQPHIRDLLCSRSLHTEAASQLQELRSANSELTARLHKAQNDCEAKVGRMQRELNSRPQPLDTFTIIDLREEAEAAIAATARAIEARVTQVAAKLQTVKRSLYRAREKIAAVSESAALRVETRVEEGLARLGLAVTHLQGKAAIALKKQKAEIDRLKTVTEAKGTLKIPTDDTKKPFEPAIQLDDSVEFISLEPTHRRGSSVNTSIDDMRTAFSNLRICKKTRHESQIWYLTSTTGEEPDYYWFKAQELPISDSQVASDSEDEAEALKSQHLTALADLAKMKEELSRVEDWLAHQGCDLTHMPLEMALNEVFHSRKMISPRPRSPLHPISVELSYDVTIMSESSQTPKIGTDAVIIPASTDQDLDGLLESIAELQGDKAELERVTEAQAQRLESHITTVSAVVEKLQDPS